MLIEQQQTACILQSKQQQILKMLRVRHEQEAVHRPRASTI